MKRIKTNSWDGDDYTKSIADHVEYRLLNDLDDYRYGIERQVQRVAEFLGVIVDKLVQSDIVDFHELDNQFLLLNDGEEVVDLEDE